MNKLVSKNSILRFKLGRKIVKAERGLDLDEPYISRGNRLKSWLKKKFSDWNLYTGFTGKSNSTNQQQLLQTTDYSWMKGGTRLRSAEEQKKWEAEVQRLKNLMKNDPRKVINKQKITPKFLSRYSDRMSEIGGVNNIRAWLEKLKNYYDAGTYNPDSVWGANTEKAYLKYLAELNNNLGLVKLEPVSISSTKESVLQNDFVQDKQTGYPSIETIRSSSPILNLQNNFASDRQNYYPSTANIVFYNPNFNWRNALAESQKLHFVKQGGQLYSRNPIKRFKSNFR